MIADRLPYGIAGVLVVSVDAGSHPVAGDGLGAPKFTHHGWVPAIGPPI